MDVRVGGHHPVFADPIRLTMPMPESSALGQEWIALQNHYEQYEKGGLLIKLFAVLLCAIGFTLALHELVMGLLLLVLWLQEGIFRTFQARLGMRILRIEQGVKTGEGVAFQLHSANGWRRDPACRVCCVEYAVSALRPTVAFPYAVLLLLIGLLVIMSGDEATLNPGPC
jgi:hypothetical protein